MRWLVIKEIKTTQFDTIFNKIEKYDNLIHVIIGPRQVGKTILSKQIIKQFSKKSQYVPTEGDLRDADRR